MPLKIDPPLSAAPSSKAPQRIEGQLEGDRELAKRVLSWITFAKRPLTTAEICCALAVEPEETENYPDNVPDSDDIVSVCAGLVIVDQESAVIRLVHYTTQEYFERTRDACIPDGQLRTTRTCLTYLCFDVFQSGSCSTEEEYDERLQEHPFLDYAAKHWGEHARTVEEDVADQVWTLLNSNSLLFAAQVRQFPVHKYGGYSKHHPTTTPLHELARFGLATVAKKVLSTPGSVEVMVNAKNKYGNTPLSLPVRQGHCEMIKRLLDSKADINARSQMYGSALQEASAEGHEQVVELLLDRGADVNVQGGMYGNALRAASKEGHELVVKMLLDTGVNVNAQSNHSSNALYAASAQGNGQVVEMLLHAGADIHAQCGRYSTAIYAVAYRGRAEVLDLLITNCTIS